jgi:hypothetical protein
MGSLCATLCTLSAQAAMEFSPAQHQRYLEAYAAYTSKVQELRAQRQQAAGLIQQVCWRC